jgi:hypothetical protein
MSSTKKSAYMGKEVWERIWFVGRVEEREGFRVRDINWGFYGQKDLGRGARGAERRLRAEIREGLDIGNLLSFSSAFTEGVAIPGSLRVLGSSVPSSGHFESLSNWYCGQA